MSEQDGALHRLHKARDDGQIGAAFKQTKADIIALVKQVCELKHENDALRLKLKELTSE